MALFSGKKNSESASPEQSESTRPPKREYTPEMKEIRQMEFVWRAFDSNSKEKSGDWYFVLWTIAIAGAAGSIYLNNLLFGLFLIIAAFAATIYASRKPRMIDFAVTRKGVYADTLFLPFSSLSHFYIAEENDPVYLLLQSKKTLSSLYTFPISDTVDTDDLHAFLTNFLTEEALEVPTYQRIMDRIGF